jgi:hypothetical protein
VIARIGAELDVAGLPVAVPMATETRSGPDRRSSVPLFSRLHGERYVHPRLLGKPKKSALF